MAEIKGYTLSGWEVVSLYSTDVLFGVRDGSGNTIISCVSDEKIARLISAAPEMYAALKEMKKLAQKALKKVEAKNDVIR